MTIPYTIPWERDIHTRISVSRADGYTWVDLLPFTTSVDIASGTVTRFGGRIAGIDGVMPQLDLVLKQDPDNKLNPQDQNSAWNKVNSQYNPLLAPMREIMVLTATTLPGVQPSSHDWIGLFRGYLGDGIRVEGDVVRVNCRSLSKRLQETYIEEPKDYGSEDGTPLEHVIQDVLDDNGLSDVELYCPESTGFMVETYSAENVQYKTVWDVLQSLATAHDFFLGDLWDPHTERMRLTLLVPPRDKDINTADFVLNYRSDFLREEREIRDTAVRNVVIGHYWDKAANEKRTITVKDDTSIAEFGRRAMEVEEEATSLIQTEAEMTTFLNAILSDLKDQQGTSYLSMPFFPQIGLFSGLVIHHPAMSSTNDFMGVESYRHSLDFEAREYRTEIVGSGRIRGGQQKWLKSETKPGSPGHPSTPPTSNVPPADVAWGHCSFITDVSLSWEPVRGATAYEIRTDSNWGYADGIVYRGNSLSHKFAPTQREYALYIKAINQAGLYSEHATPITLSLPAPNPPSMPTLTPYFEAVQVTVTPLESPAVRGHYAYIKVDDGDEIKISIPSLSFAFPVPAGATMAVQVTAYDILGEGGKSPATQATTQAKLDLDLLPPVPKTGLDESLQQEIDITKELAEDLQEDFTNVVVGPNGLVSQLQQLGEEITLKVQMTQDGKMVVVGMGMAIDPTTGQTEVGFLADVFRVYNQSTGAMESVYVIDTVEGRLFFNGDMHADGSITARMLATDALQSRNWGDHSGSFINLADGSIMLGGALNPGLKYTDEDGLILSRPLVVSPSGAMTHIPVVRGPYDPDATYYQGDHVTYGGSQWRYINATPSAGNTPQEGQYWQLYVEKGAPGQDGAQGAKGDKGDTGSQGVQGPPGQDGQTLYTWVKYADTPTTGMSDSPTGKTYIGLAYNKIMPTESSSYGDYSWSLVKGADGQDGADGIPGPPGSDGQSLYTWVRYADSPTSGMSSSPTGKKYMGIAYNKTSATPSGNYGDYSWSLVEGPQGPKGDKGDTGAQGIQGPKGADGQSQWTHIRYSVNANGNPMTAAPSASTKYIGIAVTTSSTAPSGYASYSWAKFVGEDGEDGQQGIPGQKGADGITYYTWIKYADSPTTGMSNNPAGKLYIGIAHNKTTATESDTYSDYSWSLIKGDKGEKGDKGDVGTGISSITEEYYLSTSKTTQTGGSWVTTPPAWEYGKYIWTRSKIIYSNPTSTVYTTPIVSSEWEAVENIEVGGRNLFTVSDWASTAFPISTLERFKGKFWATRVYADDWSQKKLLPNEKYTLRFKAKLLSRPETPQNNTWANIGFRLYASGKGDADMGMVSNQQYIAMEIDDEIEFSRTFTTPSNVHELAVLLYCPRHDPDLIAEVEFSEVKLEKGNKATDWTPAPEDVQGQIDKSVKSTDVEYYLSTSATALSGGSWQTTAPTWEQGKYMWSRTKVVLNDGTTSYTPSANGTCIAGAKGDKGDPAPTLKVQYSTASSGATWYDAYATGRKWMRTSADNGVTWSTPAKVVGEDGSDGVDGKYTDYQFAKNTSLTTAPTSGWADAPPSLGTTEYLWMRSRVVTSSGAGSWSTAVRISGPQGSKGDKGDTGAPGKGVVSATVTYQLHTNGTTAPTGTWSSSIPTPIKGRYLWTRTITTYTDSTSVTTYSVSYIPTDGQSGADGKGISSTVVAYQISTSGTTVPIGTWVSSPPAPIKGRYLWTRTVITYTDATTSTAYSTSYYATDGQKGDKGDKGDTGGQGPKGDTGPAGQVGVIQGDWASGKQYVGDAIRGDIVKGTNGQFYLCRATHTSSSTTRPISGGSWSTYWRSFGANLESIATKMVLVDGQLLFDNEGITMQPTGYPYRSMHLDGAQLGFWDKNNLPSVALGDLSKFKQDITNAGMLGLFPTGFTFPQAGFLMAQGNIALARSVLANSLMEIPGGLVGDGTLGRRKISEKAIGIAQLDSENLYVPTLDKQNILRVTRSNGPTSVSPNTWRNVSSFSFTKNTDTLRADVARLNITVTVTSGQTRTFQWRCSVGGSVVYEAPQRNLPSSSPYEFQETVDILVDLLPLGETISVVLAGRQPTGSGATIFTFDTRVYQNDQLPIREGMPQYAVTPDSVPGGCQLTCQISCQGACEASCQDGCEGSCQTGCQIACNTTCEKTSQSGGGCIREGTPIDVWDLEAQGYTTVPVEDLKPGMILPWYQPESDTMVHGELTQLVDASYSRDFLRIRTNNGPSIDVTFEQPFDVLADMGQGLKWYKLQAMYLRPGMQMVRPFDPEPLSTVVSVETVREPGVHFWDPKTTTGGYCVNGYADTITK